MKHTTRADRARVEAEVDALEDVPVEVGDEASIVVSVRIKGAEVDELREAADVAGVKLSRYIREAALARARAHGHAVNDVAAHLADTVAELQRRLTA